MNLKTIQTRAALLVSILLFSNIVSAQNAKSGMTEEPKDYKKFSYPLTKRGAEVSAANKGFEHHPELGMLFAEAPSEYCYEVLGKRTEKTKTFIQEGTNGKGLYVQSSTDPMHIKDAQGNWVTIQSNLVPGSTAGVYEAKQQIDPVEVNANNKGYIKIGKEGKSFTYNRSLELLYTDNNGNVQNLGNADWTKHTAGKDGIYVTDAWPGIDIEIYVLRGAAKTNFIVTRPQPQYANGKLAIRDHLVMDAGMSLYSPDEIYSGNLEVRDAAGAKLFDITEAVAYEKNNIDPTMQALDYKAKNNELDIIVPGDFLNRQASSYPVIIDPFVQASNSVTVPGSTYSAAFTVGCTVTNPVPIPSGMTINGLNWTFNYTCTGTGVYGTHGAVDFYVNGCRSPNLPGYYWFCNVAYPVTCVGNNISIYSDVASCILPAQCSYTQDVIMNFYRRITPGAACSNTSIIAATPFTATFSGNTIDPGTVTANLGSSTSPICAGTSVNLTATANYGALPYTYTWNPGNLNGQTVTVTPSTTTTYTVTITDACGNTATGTVAVYVLPTPNAPTVTSPVNICQNSTPPNLSTYVTGTNILWYTVPTGGTGSSIPPTINTSTVTTFTYYVSQTVNGCESTRTPIVINIIAQPPPPTVTTPVSICQNSTPPSITTYVTVGTNLLWYTTSVGGVGSSTAPTINTSVATTLTYYVSQTVGTCESNRVPITINIISQPPPPSVISPVTYCQFATATALSATGQNLQWYTVSVGGTGSSTAPIPSTSTPGSTTYYVSQTVNGCESNRASIIVNITAQPPAPTVNSPATFCQFQTASSLSGFVTGTNILWYTVPVGGTGSPTPPTVNTSTISNTVYYVSQTVNGCESPRTPITVVVAAQPGAPTVVTPVIYCQFDVPAPLSNSVTGTNLLWYTQPTGGTGSSTDPVINTSVAGSVTHYVSQSVGNCEGPRAAIVVTINPKPSAPVVTSPVTYCQFATATALTATGQSLLWYTVPTGGTGSSAAPVPSTTAAGTTDYYVSQTINGCESNRSTITVNINPTPSAPAVTSPVTYCQYETALPLQNSVTGTNLLWYTQPTGGTGSGTAPSINTSVTSNTTYYVSQTTNGCESNRSPIQVVVGPSPQAPAVVTPVTYCQNEPVQPLTNSVTGLNLLWYATLTGGVGTATTPTVNSAVSGTVFYYVSQGLGNCESLRSTIEVIIKPTPPPPVVVTPVELCQFEIMQLTAQGQNLQWYTQASGGTGTTSVTVPSNSPSMMIYYVSQTVNGCEGPREALTVVVKPQPVAPPAPTSYTYCQDEPGATALTATGNNLLWYDVPTGGTPLAGAPIPNTAIPGVFHYYVTQTDSSCESNRTDITVTINPKPALPVVEQVTLCQGDASVPVNVQGQNLLWYGQATGGTGSQTTPVINTADTGTTDYYVSQTVNGCEGDRALLRIIINPKVEASFNIDKDTVCDSYPLTVTFTGTAPSTAIFTWDFDGASDVTGTGAGPYSVVWDKQGVKTITVAVSNLNCSSNATNTVTVLPTPDPNYDLQQDACLNEKVRVQAAFDQMDMPGYTWDFDGATVIEGSKAGPYILQWNTAGQKVVSMSLTNIPCPSLPRYDTINIHHPLAKVESVSSNDVCTADSVLFTAQPGLDYKYEWTPAVFFGKEDNDNISAWGRVRKTGYVWLTVYDRWGCAATDSVLMTTKSCCDVFLPNTFTPNGDGKNDIFRIVSKGHQQIKVFMIIDRWGKIIFETANQYEGWDGSYHGEAVDLGNYQYYLKYVCDDSKEAVEMKGDVMLLR